jgi:asparagine synthase (glutamine-hydrolysing)
MCGIGGAISLAGTPLLNARQLVETMNLLLAHRGPDGEGHWVHPNGHVAFAHRRLAIVDLVTGEQPMTDGVGNWVTYNGEIYNYKELRGVLGQERFRTTSDTETILHGFRA